MNLTSIKELMKKRLNTNHLLINDMHSGIIAVYISDQFHTFLNSKELTLDSSNELIHITKQEVNDKCTAYFNTLLCNVDWKHDGLY